MRSLTILAAAVCAAGLILLPGNGAEAQKGGKGTRAVTLTPSKVNPWGQGGTRDHRGDVRPRPRPVGGCSSKGCGKGNWVVRDHRRPHPGGGFCRRCRR
jgi:hypothetical protein